MKKVLSIVLAMAALTLAAVGEEVLTNGDFSSGEMVPWKLFTKKGQPAATATVEEGCIHIAIDAAVTAPHERQLLQHVTVESSKAYVLSFDLKAASASAEEIVVVLARTKNFSKGHYGLFRKITPGSEWETHTFTFTTKTIDADDPAALKFNLGALACDVYVRNVSFTPKP